MAIRHDHVSNARLRREFVRRSDLGWLTLKDVAVRLEMTNYSDGSPDVSRVARMLGLAASYNNRNGIPTTQRYLSYERAVQIARAMNLDPVDVGL